MYVYRRIICDSVVSAHCKVSQRVISYIGQMTKGLETLRMLSGLTLKGDAESATDMCSC